jgi:hypothetical protein
MISLVTTETGCVEVYKGKELLVRIRTHGPVEGGIERLELRKVEHDMDTAVALTGLSVLLKVPIPEMLEIATEMGT